MFSAHFLQDDPHLLFLDLVGSGLHVIAASPEEDRGIDALDAGAQKVEHDHVIVGLGDHIGRIDAGKGLEMGVFQQA